MKNFVAILIAVLFVSVTASAQKETNLRVRDNNSAEKAIGVYLGLDSVGVRKVVLSITEDTVRFNRKAYYVEECQMRGEDSYFFIISDINGNNFYMYHEKVNNRNAYNKYYFTLKKNESDKIPMITEIINKSPDPNNVTIDPLNKREDREKQWWFNKMFAKK